MAVIVTHPTQISTFTAVAKAGGSLQPNTTYEIGLAHQSNGAYLSYALWQSDAVFAEVTTTTTDLTIQLDWSYAYAYIHLAYRVQGSTTWIALTSSSRGSYYSAKNILTYDFFSEAPYPTGNRYEAGTNDDYITTHTFMVKGRVGSEIGNHTGIDLSAGTGRIETYDEAYDAQNLYNHIKAADPTGYHKYVYYDGLNFFCKYNLRSRTTGSGSVTMRYKNIFFFSGVYCYDGHTFNFDNSRIYVLAYGMRLYCRNIRLAGAYVFGNSHTGIVIDDSKHVNYALGNNQYVYVYASTVLDNTIISAIQPQQVQQADVSGVTVKANAYRFNPFGITGVMTLENMKADLGFLFFNATGLADQDNYVFRDFESTGTGGTYDLNIGYYNPAVDEINYKFIDFKGFHGKTYNSTTYRIEKSYLTPKVYSYNYAHAVKYGIDLYRSWTYNVVDSTNTPIVGASVNIEYDGGSIGSESTDIDGAASGEFLVCEGRHDGGSGTYRMLWTKYLPFTITISKEGYQDYSITLTESEEKIDEKAVMIEEEAPIYVHEALEGSIETDSVEGSIETSEVEGSVEISVEGVVESNEISGEIEIINITS